MKNYYAVPFRAMTTGQHFIAVFTDESKAKHLYAILDENHRMPEQDNFDFEADYLGLVLIDFRYRPEFHGDAKLVYVNDHGSADVYNV